jgi:hypothetical protein
MFWKWLAILRNWANWVLLVTISHVLTWSCSHYPKAFRKSLWTITWISWIIHCQNYLIWLLKRPLRRKKDPILLVHSSRMSKKKDKKKKSVASKVNKPTWGIKKKGHLSSLWHGTILKEELQGISCNRKAKKLNETSTSSMFINEWSYYFEL